MSLKTTYLLLAIVGAIVPYVFFIEFFTSDGFALGGFMAATVVNGASAGVTSDLLLSSFVFWVYMFSRRSEGPKPWLFIVLNLAIGLSCALPAYLWASRKS